VRPLALFFFRIVLAVLDSLGIPYEFQSQQVNLNKEISWNFDRDCVEPVDQFE
jgi:hypothetical protein